MGGGGGRRGAGSGGDGAGVGPPPRRRSAGAFAVLAALLLLMLMLPRPCDAGIHVSHVVQDGRALIPLSPNFGFDPRGGGSVVATIRAPLLVYRPLGPGGAAAAGGGEPGPPNR